MVVLIDKTLPWTQGQLLVVSLDPDVAWQEKPWSSQYSSVLALPHTELQTQKKESSHTFLIGSPSSAKLQTAPPLLLVWMIPIVVQKHGVSLDTNMLSLAASQIPSSWYLKNPYLKTPMTRLCWVYNYNPRFCIFFTVCICNKMSKPTYLL